MSKLQLFAALIFPGTPTITLDGVTGILQAVERESGSGNDFNVILLVEEDAGEYGNPHKTKPVRRSFFVHTTD